MTLPKSLKTPLRWIGGKSRATNTLFAHFPSSPITHFVEPFLGGGSMSIEFTRRYPSAKVSVNDLDPTVVNFWILLRDNPDDLVEAILQRKSQVNIRETFENCRTNLSMPLRADDYQTSLQYAADFFTVNKCGFSGLMTAGFSQLASEQNFSHKNISKLKSYSEHIANWNISCLPCAEFLESLDFDKDSTLVYCDPPYAKVGKDGKSLVYRNHAAFDHVHFRESLPDASCLISYDNNEVIREMYSGWSSAVFDLSYTMHSGKVYREEQKARKELVLWNYE